MNAWRAFWERLMSLETARFILALMALIFASGSVYLLLTGTANIDPDKESIVTFALGQLFALAMMAFNRYFGRADNEKLPAPADAQPEQFAENAKTSPRDLPEPTFGRE